MATLLILSELRQVFFKKTQLITNGTQINESNSAPLLKALQIF